MNHEDALQRAREKRAQMAAAGEKIEMLNPLEKAKAHPRSLALAVAAKCWDCVCGQDDPGGKQRVRDCAVAICPLHPHRPWKSVKGRSGYLEAVEKEPI